MKPILIIRTGSSYDDLPALCARRGDEVQWFCDAMGCTVDQIITAKVYQGESLPAADSVRAVIVTGSVDMVSAQLPWSEASAQWLAQAVAQNVPVLGVCFGHQLLAHALGGVVAANPNGAEYGTVTVQQNNNACDDVLLSQLPQQLQMQAAHAESVLALPVGAICLAANAHDANHIFRHGQHAWGVQFHPEYDVEIMQDIYDEEGEHLQEVGLDVAKLRATTKDSSHGQQLLKAFYDYVSQ
ncbi:glutamine amidotransferase [Dasania marina]|uniref:glutamine amidotransferase n=1 Tax=Dasania marina TaxID=471499 RepID=UPI00037BDCA6|nr:glutamine amidotransferase [Dasania marina]